MPTLDEKADKEMRRQWHMLQLPSGAESRAIVGRVISRLQAALKKQGRLSVDRVVPCGSWGRGTNIPGSDLDLVAFLNPSSALVPPRDNLTILGIMRAAFSDDVGCRFERVPRRGDHALIFYVDGVPVDLVLARNCVGRAAAREESSTAELQAEGAMRMLLEDVDRCDMPLYMSSFSETANAFVKAQPGWVNELIRIVKHRVFDSDVTVTTSAGLTLRMRDKRDRKRAGITSYLIETLALWAALRLVPPPAARSSGSVAAVLRAVLGRVCSPSSLKARLPPPLWPPVWQRLHERDAAFRARVTEVSAQRPFVSDVACPLNNLCAGRGGRAVTAEGWDLLRAGLEAALSRSAAVAAAAGSARTRGPSRSAADASTYSSWHASSFNVEALRQALPECH
ncbi:hypothetical protein JKP88DRAFT_287354 [Tribonema minus]|uniref:Polymerase nucleotidyl transferase domain-containing protein n=1 Tax=Tribonema minus TaxID=303371 RepID=A0A835Z7I4_9STRA|nr:hypothetical protein JKP88DRAFT_287354 [Tribonema minus]